MALTPFLGQKRLLDGPWQAFERDVARLLLQRGLEGVRIVAGVSDHGGDVLASRNREQWVVQCKYTSTGPPPKEAIEEVVEASRYYRAHRLMVATSRPAGEALLAEKRRYEAKQFRIELIEPLHLLKAAELAPEYAPAKHGLRDYQVDAMLGLRESLLETGQGQVVLATGLGKTVILAELVSDLLRDNHVIGGRVLVLAHTRELVDQLHRAFWFQLPKWVSTHQLVQGEFPSYWEGVTFSTIQSAMARSSELPEFGLVVVDEAHHIGAPTFQKVIGELAPQMLAGVTATPWRGDGYDIDEILGRPVVQMSIADGLRRGYLCDVDYRLLADNIDWEFVQQASLHRYSISQLNRRLLIPIRDEEAARKVVDAFRKFERHAAIVYSPTIIHAGIFAATLRRFGLGAEVISSETERRNREVIMTRFRNGEIDAVTSVDLFNEGVDIPDVDLIVFLRATHSRRIFVQQLGRGLRMSPGKGQVIVLDFVSDLRRMAEVLELDAAVKGGEIERLGLGQHLVEFQDISAGGFLREWMLDQASLILREDDSTLQVPEFEFPRPPSPGGVQ